MKHLYPLFILLLGSIGLQAQCELDANAYIDTLVCGECITLTAFGQGQGNSIFQEDFDSGQPTGWAFTQQATFTNPCSPGNGTSHLWMGDQSGVPRALETFPYDFSTAMAGATICFDLLFAVQTGDPADAPCEGPDEPDEGVYLNYSTDGGNTWVTINYFDPNGGNDPLLTNWNNWCFQLPPAALTANTQIQWFQDNDSGAEYDHWGIDNVVIYFNDPTFEIVWQHDGYSYGIGNSGGDNPTPVCPQVTTEYIVTMSNGTTTCSDTVTVPVRDPDLVVSATMNDTLCVGECTTLNGDATVIVEYAQTPTYFNGEFEPIVAAFGQETAIAINIQDLNMTTVQPGSITEVCITNLTYFGQQIFPPGIEDIGSLNLFLECPDGTRITLVPAGVTMGDGTLLGGYTNTCFVPAGSDISQDAVPYTGFYDPDEPFDNLVGCTANGVWNLVISSNSVLSIGQGFFFGWDITFDDPEISYEADYTWSPTTGMTDPNTLTPEVCPTTTTTYTLTATDAGGCVTTSAQVTINVEPCNNCNMGAMAMDETLDCVGDTDGSLDLTVTGGTAPYTYDWDNAMDVEDPSGLAAGSYTVTVTDNAGCIAIATATITEPTNPVGIVVTNTANENCGQDDGSIDLDISGGTAGYTYTWDGTEMGSNTLPNGGTGNHPLICKQEIIP